MVKKPSRPDVPKGYGIQKNAKGMLPWSFVSEQMARSRNYWIATTRPDGRPHVTPVWGVWLEDVFYFGTDKKARKTLNLAKNPSMSVHLESGDEVVIIEGEIEELKEPSILDDYDRAYFEKYQFHPVSDLTGSIHFALRPSVVFAWLEKDFPNTATRWTFEQDS